MHQRAGLQEGVIVCVSSTAGSLVWERALTTVAPRSQINITLARCVTWPHPRSGEVFYSPPGRDQREKSAAVSSLCSFLCAFLGRHFLLPLPPPLRGGVDWFRACQNSNTPLPPPRLEPAPAPPSHPPSLTLLPLRHALTKVYRLPADAAATSAAPDDEDLVDDWEYLSDTAAAEAAAAAAAAAGGGVGLEGINLEDGGGGKGATPEHGRGGGEGGKGEGEEEEEGVVEVEEEVEPVEVLDDRLLSAFLNGLKKNLKDVQLPMLVR